jgi:uncharacterized protein YjdB
VGTGGGVTSKQIFISQEAAIPPTSITLSQTTLTISTGKSAQLTATMLPANANKNVNWVSTNLAIAQVSNTGLVSGITEGITYVGAVSESGAVFSGWCTVHVTSPVGIEPVGTNGVTVSLQSGKLYVNSPASESVQVYSLAGILLYIGEKDSGKAVFNINNLPKGVLIVRGSSGWVKKISEL